MRLVLVLQHHPAVMPFYFSLSATFSLHDCHPHQLFFHPSLRSLPILIVVCPFSCGLQLLRLSALFGSQSPFIRTELPVHIILVLTMFPVGMNRITISSLGSLILLLYTLFATVILRTQLLSQTLRCRRLSPLTLLTCGHCSSD